MPTPQVRVIGRVAGSPLGRNSREQEQLRIGVEGSAWVRSDAGRGVWLSAGKQVVLANEILRE